MEKRPRDRDHKKRIEVKKFVLAFALGSYEVTSKTFGISE